MTAAIATTEPTRLRAGNTWVWRREDLAANYPATSWTLKYALKNATQHLEFSATADGALFAVSVPIATTGAAVAGTYRMVGYVEDVGPVNRYEVYEGELIVDPAYTGTATVDDRSHARKVLDAINAVIENRATKDQEEYSIGSRMLKRTPLSELKALQQQYAAEVAAEDLADRVAAGQGGGKIVVRL